MSRREKPFGQERWTWDEIDAGRRFTKAEKRWNHMAKRGGWERDLNGNYVMPAAAAPLFIVLLLGGFVLAVLEPKGVAYGKGPHHETASMVLVGMCLFFLVYVGIWLLVHTLMSWAKEHAASQPPPPTSTPPPTPVLPGTNRELKPLYEYVGDAFRWLTRDALEHLGAAVVGAWNSVGRGFRSLPEWLVAVLGGLAFALPVVGLMIYFLR